MFWILPHPVLIKDGNFLDPFMRCIFCISTCMSIFGIIHLSKHDAMVADVPEVGVDD